MIREAKGEFQELVRLNPNSNSKSLVTSGPKQGRLTVDSRSGHS